MAKTKKGILLGAVADDMTGATDLCNTLVARGMRTIQMIGLPGPRDAIPDADAVVVALKSRNLPAAEAVRVSKRARAWLEKAGAKQFFFKYCSTFDSTDDGNIGPVGEALLKAAGGDLTTYCPAFPAAGRSVYNGHLFVGDQLISNTGMRNHPLTPMRDPDLVSVLGRQVTGDVRLVPFDVVNRGPKAIARAFDQHRANGIRHVIVDAITEKHLIDLGLAGAGLKLMTGGSGAAMGLPDAFRKAGHLGAGKTAAKLPGAKGLSAVIAGSCSVATLGQIDHIKSKRPVFYVDAAELADNPGLAADAVRWAKGQMTDGPVLIYASAKPAQVRKIQKRLGRNAAGELVENAMARVARGLVKAGVGRLVVAGGETSGAVVSSLGIKALRIGGEIDPGVPWTYATGKTNLHLALKSGNFGQANFFTRAFEVLG